MDIGKQLLECLKYKNASNKIEELDEKGVLAVSYTHLDVYKRQF